MKKLLTFFVFCFAIFSTCSFFEVCGCTSWMVFDDLTGNNTNILHKNRDSAYRKVSVALSPEGSPRRWVAVWCAGTNSGINSSGLAGVMNAGEVCIDPPMVKGKKTTSNILKVILESCDTAEQATEKLREIIASGNYYHGKSGSIFLFADSKEGYICETTAKVCSVQRYTNGYAVRSSNWRNNGMSKYVRSDAKRYLKASVREYAAFSGLNRIIDKNGKITVADIFDLSRQFEMPEYSPLKRSVCGITTTSASAFEIDKQYPGILSTAYLAIGNPRHTVYIPIPVCVEKLPAGMKSLKWASASYKRLEELKLAAPLPEKWVTFEKNSMAQYTAAKAKARKLLDEKKTEEAVKLLNSTAAEIWKQAADLLKIFK